MSAYAAAMRRHAEWLADEQLRRGRGRLDVLAPERRLVVEESVRVVVCGERLQSRLRAHFRMKGPVL